MGEDWLWFVLKKGECLKSFCINICEFDVDVCCGCGCMCQEICVWKCVDKVEQ